MIETVEGGTTPRDRLDTWSTFSSWNSDSQAHGSRDEIDIGLRRKSRPPRTWQSSTGRPEFVRTASLTRLAIHKCPEGGFVRMRAQEGSGSMNAR